MEALLDAIASPRRREILRLVWDAERSSGEIAEQIGATWPSVSRSLRVLRHSGAVDERRAGTQRFYRANRKALRPLESFLTELWRTGLGRIAELVDEEQGTSPKGRRRG